MAAKAEPEPSYVLKATELVALNNLRPNYPRPIRLEWINRGTDQPLRPSTVGMLLRTLFKDVETPSVLKLHQSSGLRALFKNGRDRDKFAALFATARANHIANHSYVAVAVFDDLAGARRALSSLRSAGYPEEAISVVCSASNFITADPQWPEGHSVRSVAGATVGGGLLGAAFGVAILSVPGIGLVAVAGAIAASAVTSIATLGGIMGATGGAVAKMLTDHDVDGVAAAHFEEHLESGRVFVSVDSRKTKASYSDGLELLSSLGGKPAFIRSP
jgi:hypothetical protein